ncbi:hypothetical protein DR999_PMT11732 [Platysternon megacephalum]|uniref:Uncharacterized protein n=1 Tax=Platysternon megacephalum TaxID=55544 RepID=A0A4D9EGR6_9SAUR|nr:hypothetical protein DR999_PMT11732 [Platysternon megacephalum]
MLHLSTHRERLINQIGNHSLLSEITRFDETPERLQGIQSYKGGVMGALILLSSAKLLVPLTTMTNLGFLKRLTKCLTILSTQFTSGIVMIAIYHYLYFASSILLSHCNVSQLHMQLTSLAAHQLYAKRIEIMTKDLSSHSSTSLYSWICEEVCNATVMGFMSISHPVLSGAT